MDQHHFLNLTGARVVATEQLLDTRDLVTDLIEVGAMGAVYGPAGAGKTFAVAQALADRPSSSWVRSTFRSRPTTRFVRHELYTALGLGVFPPTSPVETDRLMKRALGECFRLVVIDEAQWLNRECLLCGCRHKKHYAGRAFMPRRRPWQSWWNWPRPEAA